MAECDIELELLEMVPVRWTWRRWMKKCVSMIELSTAMKGSIGSMMGFGLTISPTSTKRRQKIVLENRYDLFEINRREVLVAYRNCKLPSRSIRFMKGSLILREDICLRTSKVLIQVKIRTTRSATIASTFQIT